jgi:hypothetical protein
MNLAYHDAKYADLHEETTYNALLGATDLDGNNFQYTNPLIGGHRGPWHVCPCCGGNIPRCVGTGMESHALHGDGIYYEARDKLWVNFCAPSVADWQIKKAKVEVQTDFPEGESATVKISLNSREKFTLANW